MDFSMRRRLVKFSNYLKRTLMQSGYMTGRLMSMVGLREQKLDLLHGGISRDLVLTLFSERYFHLRYRSRVLEFWPPWLVR